MRFILPFLAILFASPALFAQDSIPEMPDPIRNLADEGAQIRYLGRDNGFDSWLTVKNGQEQYFYVPPGGDGFVMGVLFDNQGRAVTVDQVRRLRNEGDTLLDSLTELESYTTTDDDQAANFEFKAPSERLFHDVETSNWVAMGYNTAPVAYAIIDPQCPHCHEMIVKMNEAGYFDHGKLQLRLIPVGFSEASRAMAAYLIASPDPQERMLRHLSGDETALPVRDEVNQQGVERNLSMMQAWKFDVTPMLIYRSKDGEVKIIRGRPKDVAGTLADLAVAR
jgi:thiol:disulfide interchange protein DsbG